MMKHNDEKIAELILKYRLGDLSTAEGQELDEWLKDDNNLRYFNQVLDNSRLWQVDGVPEPNSAGIWEKINKDAGETTVIPLKNGFNWKRLMAAAAVFLIVAMGGWIFLNSRSESTDTKKNTAQVPKNDALPGTDKAILTLSDGRTITLDETPNGTVAKQGDVAISKTGGSLAYSTHGSASPTTTEKVMYNMLSTPRGGKFTLELPDGSKVWLNAASSIRYPSEFTGDVRKVEVTGEAYLEVAKNPNMPFIVQAKGQDITVLGTTFNVNAYDDESIIKTTLLEGSVRISQHSNGPSQVMPALGGSVTLKPGEQASFENEGRISVDKNINVDQQVAWVKGYFHFKNQDVEAIMRQVARWYDLDVVYEGHKPSGKYTGKINRDTKASVVLKLLQDGGIQYKIDGNKITISE